MTGEETTRLVTLANRIAANLAFYEDGAERTADHLRRFWAPSMRHGLVQHLTAGGEGLTAVARGAAECLAREG